VSRSIWNRVGTMSTSYMVHTESHGHGLTSCSNMHGSDVCESNFDRSRTYNENGTIMFHVDMWKTRGKGRQRPSPTSLSYASHSALISPDSSIGPWPGRQSTVRRPPRPPSWSPWPLLCEPTRYWSVCTCFASRISPLEGPIVGLQLNEELTTKNCVPRRYNSSKS
jgi:hypothetical protein